MLIALFADIHANREAFDACLAAARRRGAQRYAFLGDLVGYGADPGYVVDRVAEFCASGALAIKGNHDAAIAVPQESMNLYARAAIDWTRGKLSRSQKEFLAGLPLTAEAGEVLFVHAEAYRPANWTYITQASEAQRSMRATDKRVTVSGHTHCPRLFHMTPRRPASCFVPSTDVPIHLAKSHKWHAVLGSVGQPRDEIPSAAYAIYDDHNCLLTFARTPYDIERAAHKIKAAGLPEILSARLYIGR